MSRLSVVFSAAKFRKILSAVAGPLDSLAAPRLMLFGYLSYVLTGWLLLCLPWSAAPEVSALDHLFTAMSAVSTTGLVTVDTGAAYTGFGQAVIALLIQAGGIGYMTFSSFVVIASANRISRFREKVASATFALPSGFEIRTFIVHVVGFTLFWELLGAVALSAAFVHDGVPNPLWQAVFHSISAFCTAGFGLYSNSFEGFRDHFWVNLVLSVLSLLGALGFIVCLDVWDNLRGLRKSLLFTTQMILSVTFWLVAAGTVLVFLAEPSLKAMPPDERLMVSFFQVMTASTTVGFNTVPIGALSAPVLFLLVVLMAIGASPSGTGGGLKVTTVSALVGLVKCTLRGEKRISLRGRIIPSERVQLATASLAYYFCVTGIAVYLLLLTEKGDFLTILFEAASALGTVGLSMGITASLTTVGKLTIIVLMLIGRVGFLTFGMALTAQTETPAPATDNELVI